MRYWFIVLVFGCVRTQYDIYESADMAVLASRLNTITPQSPSQMSIISSLNVLASIIDVFEKELKEEQDLNKQFADLTQKLANLEDKKATIEQFLIGNGVKQHFKELNKLKKKVVEKRAEADASRRELDDLRIAKENESNLLAAELIDCKNKEAYLEHNMKIVVDLTEKLKRIYEQLSEAMKNFENQLVNKQILVVKTMELEDAKSNFFNGVKEYDQCLNEIEDLKLEVENLTKENTNLIDKLKGLREQSSKLEDSKKKFDSAILICEELEDIKRLFEQLKVIDGSMTEIDNAKTAEYEIIKQTLCIQEEARRSNKEKELLEKEVTLIPTYLDHLHSQEQQSLKALESLKQSCSHLNTEVEKFQKYNKIALSSLVATVLVILSSFGCITFIYNFS